MNVIHVSKLLFSVLVLVGQLCHVFGAVIYKTSFRAVDTRLMIIYATTLHVIGAFLDFSFAKRWNLEFDVSDYVFLFLTDCVFECINTILY
jgi:hypothetical protein